MVNFKNRRSFPRVFVCFAVFINDGEQRLPADIEDLTVHGVSFKLESPLEVGSKIWVEIAGNDKIRKNELEARILRCDPIEAQIPKTYLAAAKFVEPNDEYLMDILALVHNKVLKA